MKERPILFSAPMVRAILDGRKTQTRRIAKVTSDGCKEGFITPLSGFVPRSIENHISYCPYGKPGDRLWVRETWSREKSPYHCNAIFYRADGESYGKQYALSFVERESKWRPSIHMPRWASRILLEITCVRVERLQDISENDAVFEGLKALTKDDGLTIKYGIPDRDGYPGNDDHGWDWRDWNVSPVLAYKKLWESINGQGSWDLNPWVWCITFEVLQRAS